MTSPVDTSVKYFHSGMAGAPILSGTAGAMIAVLDACLVNGFGLKTVDSIVVAGNVATVNISTGHSAEVGTVAYIAGATPAELNGEQKVTAITAGSLSFATAGVSNQTATGTIAMKLAPAGWTKPFGDSTSGAYKAPALMGTGCLLRVDDTQARTARVVGYETMSDIDTGTGPFPTAAQRSGGSWWSKSNVASTASRTWMLVSDGRMFYFARANHPSYSHAHELTVFGDYLPIKSGDPFACVISGLSTDASGAGAYATNNYWASDATNSSEIYSPRSYTGLGASCILRRVMPQMAGANAWHSGGGAAGAFTPYPNPTDGGLYTVPHYLSEDVSVAFRGVSPGFYGCPQSVANGQFTTRDSVIGVTGLAGKTLKALTCNYSGIFGVCFFDITGPWR